MSTPSRLLAFLLLPLMIGGELVNLRAVEQADAAIIWRWYNDSDLMRYWGISDATVSLSAVQTRIEEWLSDEQKIGRPICFLVDDLNRETVGLVIFSEYEPVHQSVALSLLIGEQDCWGQGLGSDTLQTVIDYCFTSWNLHRLWLRVEAFNERAQRLYRRFGFVHEATLHHETYLDGTFQDVLVFGLLADDIAAKADTL